MVADEGGEVGELVRRWDGFRGAGPGEGEAGRVRADEGARDLGHLAYTSTGWADLLAVLKAH